VHRKGLGALVFFLALTFGLVAYTLVAGNSPLLGLDLQGGVSVVLQPSDDLPEGAGDNLDQAVDIIRNRVDALGVAEPDITRQGDTVLVQLPGVGNQDRALELVGQTAELRFRPVLQVLPPVGAPVPTTPGGEGTATTAPGATTTVPAASGPAPTDADAGEQGLGSLVPGENAAGRQTTTTAGGGTTTTAGDGAPVPTTATTLPADPAAGPCDGVEDRTRLGADGLPARLDDEGLTPRRGDEACDTVVLAERDEAGAVITRYLLGPTALTGETLAGASAGLDQSGVTWLVRPTFKGGADGIDLFNAVAAECFSAAPTCPTSSLAIVLDSEVISAPQIQTDSFERDQIQITGDFDESSAKDLALVLEYGALPVTLEPQQTQTVSATLGEDSLRAGIIAGAIGLVLTSVFMVAYYRLLGLVAIASLLLEFALLWSLISYLGESRGLALTLAGVTGVIVSIGISLDSNVVFYENLKEDVRNGRTFRSTVERSFDTSFSTIIKADVASLIGAGLLYWLSVGPVRGFALLLGISTLLDIFASWFFIRPAVLLLSRRPGLRARETWFGMPTAREVV
jgi:preprotein translocase subunit SecD